MRVSSLILLTILMSEKGKHFFCPPARTRLVSYLRTKAKGIRIILLCDVVFGSVYKPEGDWGEIVALGAEISP